MTALNDIHIDARYTIRESAALIGKSVPTIYRYAKRGLLTIRYNKLNNPYIQGKQLKALLS